MKTPIKFQLALGIATMLVSFFAQGESEINIASSSNVLASQHEANGAGSRQKYSKLKKLALLKQSLDKIYVQYRALPKTADSVEKLYQLHLKVKALREEIVKLDSGAAIYDEKYWELGLYMEHFAEWLEYSPRLLVEIHKINPNSAHREEAWYAAINEGREYGGPGKATAETLKEYLDEFPNEKYASQIYYDLGNYYNGLYNYLRHGDDSVQDRASCYASYQSNHSIKEQLKELQTAGIASYKKALDLERDSVTINLIKSTLRNLSQGKKAEYDGWCDTMD